MRNALELANAAKASKMMTGIVEVEEPGIGAAVMKREVCEAC
jgi:hypothetical protein